MCVNSLDVLWSVGTARWSFWALRTQRAALMPRRGRLLVWMRTEKVACHFGRE